MQKFTTRPRRAPRSILTCSECGIKSGHVKNNPKAWNGWIVTPYEVCPDCIAKKVPYRIVESTQAGKVIRTIIFPK
jgi:hypothetical protein